MCGEEAASLKTDPGRYMVVLAAQSDATWHRRPSTTGSKRWHVVSDEGATPACGAPMMLQDDRAIDAAEVPQSSRCQRPGCKQLWPDVKAHSGEYKARQ